MRLTFRQFFPAEMTPHLQLVCTVWPYTSLYSHGHSFRQLCLVHVASRIYLNSGGKCQDIWYVVKRDLTKAVLKSTASRGTSMMR